MPTPRHKFVLALCLLIGPANLAAQVLNMSHDLVPLGIASQNLTPLLHAPFVPQLLPPRLLGQILLGEIEVAALAATLCPKAY